MVVLPDPDSPTRPTTSPRLTVKLTPSMARMTGGFAPNQGASPPKCLVRPATSSSGVPDAAFCTGAFSAGA